ncbi:phage major capsid protein [Azospirillum lipoferum]|uniref:Phage major capsid protein n=2 Tax=Azospirillaceae TaxID=2829815 RepID=A0A5A9GUV5_AZOLI|nr:phage major capsid protein [Azospirillum lipoferum]
MSGAVFDPKRPVPTPPFHANCRSYLRAITTAKRKPRATDAEVYRQNFAIYRRLQREAKAAAEKAAAAEGRADDERLELRFAPSLDGAGTFTGIANAYGVLDAHRTEFRAGAFAASIAERRAAGQKVPLLLHHDPERPCGVVEELRDAPDGLHITGRFLLTTPDGREAHDLAKVGAVSLSVGFRRLRDEPRPGGGRIITEARLAEVSVVSIASNPKARILEVRAASPAAPPAQQKEAAMALDNEAAPNSAENTETRTDTTAETRGAIDAINKRLDKIEARAGRAGLAGGEQRGEGELERRAYESYLRHGDRAPADEMRALTVSNDPQGGYLAPAEISTEFIRDLVEFSPIRAMATVRQTAAPSVKYPRRTGVTNAQWEGEGDDHAESTVPFGQVDIPARNLSTFVDISNQLLADSSGTAEAEVRRALAEDFGQKEGLAFVSGSGPLQPEGLLTASGVGYTATGNASTLGSAPADLLITAMYALPAAYRARGTWLMNGSTLAAIRKLKDGATGTYLWQPAYAAGQPETILGRPVVEVPDMDDVGSGATPIAFGDIATAYRIVDRLDMSILVNPYLLATRGITRIHATRRVGGAVVQPAALRKIKCATS